MHSIKKVIISIVDWFLYTFLKEKHKKFLSDLFTTRQKQLIKNIIKPGKKQAQMREVERLKIRLYNLGFTDKALADLEAIVRGEVKNTYMKRLAAWEIALWHANQYTKDNAQKSLSYLPLATKGVKDKDFLRRATILKAESLDMIGKTEEAKDVILRTLASDVHADLYLALASVETSFDKRVESINKALKLFDIPEITVEKQGISLYDSMHVQKAVASTDNNSKVTVIIPVYNAGEAVRTAVESMLSQSWTNLEVFAVDDCSTDNTMEILKEYAQKDARFHVLSTPVNSGPYVARNIALSKATGEFVTINDADDWSHPLKIETQVKHLLDNKQLIGNFSQQARATEELKFYRRGKPGLYIFSNMSSFMFRRQPVIEKIGYWDNVRFAGDSEFVKRVKLIFGEKSIKELPTALLSFQRQSGESLTGNSAFGFPGFFMGVRKEYAEAHEYYHHHHLDNLRYDFPQSNRLFPVPEPMWPQREEKVEGKRHFDVILASEFRLMGGTNMSNVEEIKAQKKMGIRTGLVQLNRYDLQSAEVMNPKVREQIDGDKVQMVVYGEKVTCDVLIIRHPPVLQDWQKYIPKIDAKKVYVIANQTPKKEYSETGETLYDLGTVENRVLSYFGKSSQWFPIGPLIREVLIKEHHEELKKINLSDEDWINIIDVNEWRRKSRPNNSKIKIGRHSRDQYVKWPIDKQEMLSVYPDSNEYEIHVLGGAKMPKKVLGQLPANWHVSEFGEIEPKEFLAAMDVFVYYTHPELVEAFGRVIFEAMAVGVPVIIPPNYKVLFQDAAIYAKPNEVQSKIQELMNDDVFYQRQVEKAFSYVEKHFGYSKHERRLGEVARG